MPRAANGACERHLDLRSRSKFTSRVWAPRGGPKSSATNFSPVEIHEGMARYPGISILVVNEFLLLLLETPSRHLITSGVVATPKKCNIPDIAAHSIFNQNRCRPAQNARRDFQIDAPAAHISRPPLSIIVSWLDFITMS